MPSRHRPELPFLVKGRERSNRCRTLDEAEETARRVANEDRIWTTVQEWDDDRGDWSEDALVVDPAAVREKASR